MMVTCPIDIKVDFEAHAAYVRYRRLPAGEHVARTVDVIDDGAVAADFDAHGDLVGIELLGCEGDLLDAAQRYAGALGFRFPRDLAGVMPGDDRRPSPIG